jgi:UDP-3-O-[3-hydroxymyristoyl] N-acetylglucosamine deacetylase
MQSIYQKTIIEPISFSGIGLHSGIISKIKIYPAKANQGIVFKRTDLKENNLVEANFMNVSSAILCTTLENIHGVKVSTVEHLLAAFYIAGIDNALVEINCEEMPIMDGSSKNFLDVFKEIKIISLLSKRKYLKVNKKVQLKDGEKIISIEPNQTSLEVDFQLNYKNKIIGNQRNCINFQTDELEDVSNSRTFCLFEDIEKIKKIGLAKGGSLENAVVVDENKVLNKNGLRNKKEFVNHKILDLIGDFVLSGYRILGKVKCYQGGHELTNLFLRDLLKKNQENITIIELDNNKISEISKDTLEPLAVNA